MAALTLYHIAPSRSSVAHWMLEEIGEPFDLHVLNSKKGENRQPDYLAINPIGKAPALRHGDVVITELAAICCYLADAFPQAKLNVPLGDPRRGPYLKWLFFNPARSSRRSSTAPSSAWRTRRARRSAMATSTRPWTSSRAP